MDQDRRSLRLAPLLMLLGLLALLAALWFARSNPIAGYTPLTDSGVYLYIGQQMLRGAAPYRDIFDNKGPLLYAVNVLGLLLGFGSFWGVYVLEYCLLALSTTLTFQVLRVRVGWLVAGVATLFFVLEVGHIATQNHEEEYAVVLQAVALFLLARKPTLETRAWPWFAAGALAAGAFFLKPTGLGFSVALVVTLLLVCWRTGAWRVAGRLLLAGLVGAVAASIPVAVYLVASGALGASISDFLLFNFTYIGANGAADRWHSVAFGAGSVGLAATAAVLVAWVLTLRRVLWPHDEGRRFHALALLAVIWLPVEVVLAMTSGNARPQYYFLWLLPATLLLGLAIHDLSTMRRPATTRARQSARQSASRVSIILLVLLAFGGLLAPTNTLLHWLAVSVVNYDTYISRKGNDERLADYVASRTKPNDYVLVWGGYNANINMLAERRSPTRYVMQLSLYFFDDYARKGVPQFLKDLKTHPPSMVLDSSPSYGPEWSIAVPPIDSETNPWASSPAVHAAWATVFDYLHQHYRSVGRVNFAPYWEVYVRR